jgi:hypothetical protein
LVIQRDCRSRQDAKRRNTVRPNCEGLEDRKLLYATTGGQWAFSNRITYSFAPDGTNIGGYSSAWLQTMNNDGISTADWQLAFEKAAAIWQAVSGINMVQVPDNGAAFGGSGDQQGDPNFGDVRIGGIALSSSILGEAFYPPPINGGTSAGDIVMNTHQPWHVNNDYDIETVAIHEFGHALGMSHSSIRQAEMYSSYQGMNQSLNSDDTAGIQSIYGPRPTDNAAGHTMGTATNITSQINGQGQATLSNLVISVATDYNYFFVQAPANTNGTMTVAMQSSALSSLTPKLTVFNSAQQTLGTAAVSNTFGATVTVTITGVSPGQGFYIRGMAANPGAGGNGSYAMNVNFSAAPSTTVAPPNTVVVSQPSQGGGSGTDQIGGSGGGGGGGLLGGLLGLVGGLVEGVLGLLHIGTLQGYGDALTAGPHIHPLPVSHHHVAPTHHPAHHAHSHSSVNVHLHGH